MPRYLVKVRTSTFSLTKTIHAEDGLQATELFMKENPTVEEAAEAALEIGEPVSVRAVAYSDKTDETIIDYKPSLLPN